MKEIVKFEFSIDATQTSGGRDDTATGVRLGSAIRLLLGKRLRDAAVATCTTQPNELHQVDQVSRLLSHGTLVVS